MFWRVAVTAGIWFLGLSFVQWDGQVFHHSIAMLAAAIVGSLPWIRLAFSKPGTRGRVTAILIVALSAIAVVWIAFDLPRAYESQRRFNEEARRTVTPNSGLQLTVTPLAYASVAPATETGR